MRIVIVITAADVDVIDVEQDVAIGQFHQRGQEFPFRDRRVPILNITGKILDQQAPADKILRLTDTGRDMVQGFLGVGQRQQVVEVTPRHRAPAQMFRNQPGFYASNERLQLLQMVEVERIGRAKRKTDAVQTDRVMGAGSFQVMEWNTVQFEIIFTVYFHPANIRTGVEQRAVVTGTKTNPASRRDRGCYPGVSLGRHRIVRPWVSAKRRQSSRRCPWAG